MRDPLRVFIGGLLPPAVVEEEVEAAVAIHIADAGAVMELLPLALRGDGLEFPRLLRRGRIRLYKSPLILPMRDQLRPAVAVHIEKRRRLAFDALEDEMLLPRSVGALGIFIPERLMQMHAPEDENVRPAISIEVPHVTEHGIRR